MHSLVGVNVSVCARLSAGAVEQIARVRVAVQVREVGLDRGVTCSRVRAEPGGIAGSGSSVCRSVPNKM